MKAINKKGIILLGSANSEGETFRMVTYLQACTQFPILDLKKKNIAPFDYAFKNKGDDFLPLLQSLVKDYELLVLATPVYWYTMSGLMKTFFDRLSDLLMIEKETGRQLRGMEMAVLSCGADKVLKEGFYMPFEATAAYLGMNYLGAVHGWIEDGEVPSEIKTQIQQFARSLVI